MFLKTLLALVLLLSNQLTAAAVTKVYGNNELVGIQFIDTMGSPKGFWIDLLSLINKIDPSLNLVADMQGVRYGASQIKRFKEKALVGMVLDASKTREAYRDMLFSEGFGDFSLRFYSLSDLKTQLQKANPKVAVIGKSGGFAKGYLESRMENANLVLVNSFDEALNKLIRNEVDLYFGADWPIRYFYHHGDFKNRLDGLIEGPKVFSSQMTFATHTANKDLITKINAARQKLTFNGNLYELEHKWLGVAPPSIYIDKKIEEIILQRKNHNLIANSLLATLLALLLVTLFSIFKIRGEKKNSELYAAKLAHDIKNPLNALYNFFKGYSSLNHIDKAKTIKSLEEMATSSFDQINRIINETLYLNKRKINPAHSPVEPCNIYVELQQTAIQTAAINHTALSFSPTKVPDNDQAHIINIEALQLVFRNLLNNACVNASNNFVTVSLKERGKKLEIDILNKSKSDATYWIDYLNAKGAPSPFKYSLTNTGLYLCKNVINREKWSLRAESVSNTASVKFYIPLIKVKQKTDFLLVDQKHTDQKCLNIRKILVVDDSSFNLSVAKMHLENQDYEVVTAIGGPEAIEELRNHPTIDLVILDFEMPVLNGYETAEKLVKLCNYPPEKIVVLSGASITSNYKTKFSALGVNRFLEKPFDFSDFSSLNI